MRSVPTALSWSRRELSFFLVNAALVGAFVVLTAGVAGAQERAPSGAPGMASKSAACRNMIALIKKHDPEQAAKLTAVKEEELQEVCVKQFDDYEPVVAGHLATCLTNARTVKEASGCDKWAEQEAKKEKEAKKSPLVTVAPDSDALSLPAGEIKWERACRHAVKLLKTQLEGSEKDFSESEGVKLREACMDDLRGQPALAAGDIADCVLRATNMDEFLACEKHLTASEAPSKGNEEMWRRACEHVTQVVLKVSGTPANQLSKEDLASIENDCFEEFRKKGGDEANEMARCFLLCDSEKTCGDCEPLSDQEIQSGGERLWRGACRHTTHVLLEEAGAEAGQVSDDQVRELNRDCFEKLKSGDDELANKLCRCIMKAKSEKQLNDCLE